MSNKQKAKERRKRFEKMRRIKNNNLPKRNRGFNLTQKMADVNYELVERNKKIISERKKISNKVHKMGASSPDTNNSDRA
jgi:hypothetical protein